VRARPALVSLRERTSRRQHPTHNCGASSRRRVHSVHQISEARGSYKNRRAKGDRARDGGQRETSKKSKNALKTCASKSSLGGGGGGGGKGKRGRSSSWEDRHHLAGRRKRADPLRENLEAEANRPDQRRSTRERTLLPRLEKRERQQHEGKDRLGPRKIN